MITSHTFSLSYNNKRVKAFLRTVEQKKLKVNTPEFEHEAKLAQLSDKDIQALINAKSLVDSEGNVVSFIPQRSFIPLKQSMQEGKVSLKELESVKEQIRMQFKDTEQYQALIKDLYNDTQQKIINDINKKVDNIPNTTLIPFTRTPSIPQEPVADTIYTQLETYHSFQKGLHFGQNVVSLQNFLYKYLLVRPQKNWEDKKNFNNAEVLLLLLSCSKPLEQFDRNLANIYPVIFKNWFKANQDILNDFVLAIVLIEQNLSSDEDKKTIMKPILTYLRQNNFFIRKKLSLENQKKKEDINSRVDKVSDMFQDTPEIRKVVKGIQSRLKSNKLNLMPSEPLHPFLEEEFKTNIFRLGTEKIPEHKINIFRDYTSRMNTAFSALRVALLETSVSIYKSMASYKLTKKIKNTLFDNALYFEHFNFFKNDLKKVNEEKMKKAQEEFQQRESKRQAKASVKEEDTSVKETPV